MFRMWQEQVTEWWHEADAFLFNRGPSPLLARSFLVGFTVYLVVFRLLIPWISAVRFKARRTSVSIDLHLPTSGDSSTATTRRSPGQSPQDPMDSSVIHGMNPATGEYLGRFHAMDAVEVETAVRKAKEAQKIWAETTFEQRKEFLRLLQDYILEHQELICRIACIDSGKTMVDASFGEILTTCEKIRWTVAEGEQALMPSYRSVGWIAAHKTACVEYHPLGLIAAIVSWNYPFHNVMGPIISALFAGNGCVVKVSEYATWSSLQYEKIIKGILHHLGHPVDLVQFITGFADSGRALVQCRQVDKIIFIGSPSVGKKIMAAAAENLTPVVLELGGKDAAIICEDCDFEQVIHLVLRGTFQNCGQNCIGLERLVVHEGIYERFINEMTRYVKDIKQGPPLNGNFDCGAMTMGSVQIEGIQSLVDDAVRQGARLLVGGQIRTHLSGGSFYPPTVLTDVRSSMRIAQEEVFGPVMVIFRAANDSEAISIVNDCPYGLGASVFSCNYSRAEVIGKHLRTGMLNINDFGVNYLCQSLPFGGVKISGFDRFAGIEGLRGNCLVKAVTSDRFALLGIRTKIPKPLQYPIGNAQAAFHYCKSLIDLIYSEGNWSKRYHSLIELLKRSF